MDRIAIIGCGGSSKTHLANQLAALLDLPLTHLDGIYYDADWNPLPPDDFARHQQQLVEDRLLATLLHDRLALPQVAIAALFDVRPETINRRIRDTRRLLEQADHTIQPTHQPLTTLNDLYHLATTAGITIPTWITTAS